MRKNILITGGAGFIGSHLTDELLNYGHKITILDNLSPQVHGNATIRPQYLNKDSEFIYGDVRNPSILSELLKGKDVVYHLAAAVGVGQSMYEIERYTNVNAIGTAVLLEEIIKNPVEKLIVASSMSVYGEGLYRDDNGASVNVEERSLEQLKKGIWEIIDKKGKVLQPVPTTESKIPSLSSVYALSKYYQERESLIIGKAYDIPVVALRFFNVYGTRQALSNPYTGVLAIFASRYLNNKQPFIFEDGRQMRDFVSVHDITEACKLCLEKTEADGKVLNVGSGNPITIKELANKTAEVLGKSEIEPAISGKYRAGDIRNCFADISLAKELINYTPKVKLEEGLTELAGWLADKLPVDLFDKASSELAERGLTI